MLKDSYFGANARRGTAPLLTVTRDAFDRLSLLSGLLQHVTTLVEQHRKVNLCNHAIHMLQHSRPFPMSTSTFDLLLPPLTNKRRLSLSLLSLAFILSRQTILFSLVR